MLRRTLLASPVVLAAPARAQGGPVWNPGGAVRVVVPFPAGNAMDVVIRLLAPAVQADLGQPVVVDNRPGGSTLLGTEAVARSAPDGLTLLGVANSFLINASLHRPAPYDPLRQFSPLAWLTVVPHVLAAHPAVAADFPGFLARGRQPGAGLSFGSTGVGTSLHLGAEQLKLQAGLNATHVPYRGTAQLLTDLYAGRLDYMFANLPDVLQPVRDGKLRALALSAPARSPYLPDLPTLGELGFPGVVSNSHYGVVMPAGGASEVQDRQARAWLAALHRPELRGRLEATGFDVLGLGPAEFGAAMRRDVASYAEVVRAANLTVE